MPSAISSKACRSARSRGENPAMSFLAIDGVSRRFGRLEVLRGASLAVERGETIAISGPSGAGKTVLLRLIAGIVAPDSGDIRIGDRSVVALGPEARDVGMAFQTFALYPHGPAFENIASPLRGRGMAEADIKRRGQP